MESNNIIANGNVDDGNAIASDKDVTAPNELMLKNENCLQPDQAKSVKIIDVNDVGNEFKFKGALIEEEKSIFQKAGTLKLQEAIPIIPRRVAIACLVLNCLCPGLGTVVSGFAAIVCPCDPYMCKRWFEILVINVTAGICQVATMLYLLIGYFWGIYWGILMVQKAPSPVQEKRFKVSLFGKNNQSHLKK
eukprot:gene20396-22409_t